jgi:hypothetical protein
MTNGAQIKADPSLAGVACELCVFLVVEDFSLRLWARCNGPKDVVALHQIHLHMYSAKSLIPEARVAGRSDAKVGVGAAPGL